MRIFTAAAATSAANTEQLKSVLGLENRSYSFAVIAAAAAVKEVLP